MTGDEQKYSLLMHCLLCDNCTMYVYMIMIMLIIATMNTMLWGKLREGFKSHTSQPVHRQITQRYDA